MSDTSLKEKTAKGLFWGGFSNGIQQLLNLGFGIVLARLLDASDYGMVGMLTIFSAIAAALHIFDFALPIAPSFYKLDLSELPVMICTFYLGPVSGVVCEFLKILLKLLIKGTSTAFVGDLANFLVGCSFVLPASICYQATLSKKGAIWSLTLGTLVMTVFGSLFNAWYLIPQFVKLFHMPLESIIAAGTAIFSSVTDLKTLVLFCIVPFNLIKGAAVSVLTFLLYKRVEGVFFRRKKNADSQ